MNDYESHSELDDELLSAYLDDELSPEERAAVETRLAADPSAQQLLHQLRAVSEAVQAMPQEVVGHDMRVSILQRAEQKSVDASATTFRLVGEERDASNGQPAAAVEPVPKFTIGRTRRGWAWAALAIAAALLIMAFQREPAADKLPVVAQVEDRPAGQRGRFGNLELRAPSGRAAPAGAVSEPTAVPPGNEAWSIATTDLDAAPSPTSGSGAQPAPIALGTEAAPELSLQARVNQPADQSDRSFGAYAADDARMNRAREPSVEDGAQMPAADHLSAVPPPPAPAAESGDLAQSGEFADAPAEGAPAEGIPAASADEQPAAPAIEDPLVVVRVLAKQSALESKQFYRLLERNGIEVEPAVDDARGLVVDAAVEQSAVEEAAGQPSRHYAQTGQVSGAAGFGAAASGEATSVDAVLVEAPPATITACMSSLNQDQENFLGLEVDPAPATAVIPTTDGVADSTAGAKISAKQKLAEDLDLAKFNRGSVPQENDAMTRDKDRFYGYDPWYFSGGGRLGGYGGQERSLQLVEQERLSRARKGLSESSKGRAVRLEDVKREERMQERAPQQQAARGGRRVEAQAAPAARKLAELGRESQSAEQLEQLTEERLQVLFLISSDAAAPATTPAQNKAQ